VNNSPADYPDQAKSCQFASVSSAEESLEYPIIFRLSSMEYLLRELALYLRDTELSGLVLRDVIVTDIRVPSSS